VASPIRTEGGGPEFRILGPLEVYADGQPIDPGPGKQRALLAILLIHRREALSTDRLIDELWEERPPATATKAVQVYVSRLRKLLGPDVLITRGGGYALDAGPGRVDVDRFEALAREGREAVEAGDVERAAETLRRALAIWRGEPLADFAYESFAQAESRRLEQARLAAIEDRIDADLALGRHAELIGELETLAAEHPRRERLQGRLILALYRSGRQADALERYAEVRRRFVDDLGIEPGAELQRLQAAILAQDPALDAPRRPSLLDRSGARTRFGNGGLLIAGGGLVLLAAAIAAAVISGGDDQGPEVAPNSVAVIDSKDGQVVADVAVGARPAAISAGEGAIWVANFDDDSISQIDPDARAVTNTTALDTRVDGLGAGAGGVWAVDLRRLLLVEMSPLFRNVVQRVDIRTLRRDLPSALEIGRTSAPVAVADGSVWLGNGSAAVLRVSPDAGEVRERTDVGNDPRAIAVSDSSVWVADAQDDTVTRIDPASGAAAQTIPAGQAPGAIAAGEGGVWVANAEDDTVTRIDPDSGSAVTTIGVGERPTGVTTGAGSVWVGNSVSGTVSRIDPNSNEVVETIAVGHAPQALAFSEGMVWVAVQEGVDVSPPATEDASSSVLRIAASEDPGPLDPAFFFGGGQISYATCAGLFNYPDAPAPEGARLVPEVAAESPTVSDGGLTYTFTIRPGFRFSPPSNEPVTAEAFERAFERALDPRIHPYAARLLQNVVGAREFATGRARTIEGLRATGDTLEIRLETPAPDFPTTLATPWFCAVPPETPVEQKGVPVVPSAGPYYVETHDPGKRIVLLRNPNYHGPRPSEFAEVDYAIGVSPRAGIEGVEAGRFDWYRGSIAPEEQARLEVQYGAGSEAAEAGRQQYFVESTPGLFLFALNTTRPPFDQVRLRRAVNFAIDRAALAREPFPDEIGQPTDQYIPPGFPGFADEAIYPLGGPDVARARELAGDVHRRATLYTCNEPACAESGEIVRANLAAIGIEVEVRQFPLPTLFQRLLTPGEPFELAQFGWSADSADPATFINSLFASPQQPYAYLDDRRLQDRMAQAARLSGPERYRAYARLDRDLASEGAAVAYASQTSPDFFSARIGCQVNQPLYGMDLGSLCLR
jgi:YVTN family beta-propeller protein